MSTSPFKTYQNPQPVQETNLLNGPLKIKIDLKQVKIVSSDSQKNRIK